MSDTQENNWIQTFVEPHLSKLPPKYIALVILLLILGSLFYPNLKPSDSLTCKTTQPNSSVQYQYNGRAEYERLKIGDSLLEVESVLGRGEEIERTETTATFVWKNPDCSLITVVFENGKLKSKKQSNLK